EEERGGDVAARVTRLRRGLQADEDGAVVAVQRRPQVGEHGGDDDVAGAVLLRRADRRGRGRGDLTHGYPVGLPREALEGTLDEGHLDALGTRRLLGLALAALLTHGRQA